MEIAIVVAADSENGIGLNNQLLCHLPNDLKYFKRITSGSAILMGRKTYDSIGRPLPNRTNMVLSKSIAFIEGCEVFSDIPLAIEYAHDHGFTHFFVIGGDTIYKQTLPFCNKVYLTRIHHVFESDAKFEALPLAQWKLESSEYHEADEKNAYAHTFEVYNRV